MPDTAAPARRTVEGADPSWLSSYHRSALAAIILIGIALRLYRVGAQGVWFDEAFTIAHSIEPFDELWRTLFNEGGRHPPLHYWILHAWFSIAGFGVTQARLLSVVFGTLSIPLLYTLTRRFANASTSLAAALLLAVSQVAIYFSQEARSYSAAQCASLLTAVAFMRLLERPTLERTAGLALASLALLATHYYGVATLAALGLFWLIFRKDYTSGVFRRMVTAGAVVAVLYVPWPLSLRSSAASQPAQVFRARQASERPGALSPLMALNRFNNGKFSSIEAESPLAGIALGLVLFTLPVVAGLWLARPRSRARTVAPRPPPVRPDDTSMEARLQWQGLLLGCLLAAGPVAVATLAGLVGAVFNYRHYSFAVPGYYLAVAIGAHVAINQRRLRVVWLAAVVGLSLAALRANYFAPTKPDYRAGLAPLAAAYENGDCAVARPDIWNDSMHLAWPVYYRDRGSPRMIAFDALPAGAAGCDRIWVIWDTTWWMNHNDVERARTIQITSVLQPTFTLVGHHAHPDVDLRLFRRVSARQ